MSNFAKRLIFGLLYVVIVVYATIYSPFSFFIMVFGFMLFSIYEMNLLIHSKSKLPYFIGIGMFLIAVLNLLPSTLRENPNVYLNLLPIRLGFIALFVFVLLLLLYSTFIIALFKVNIDIKAFFIKKILPIIYPIFPFILLLQIPYLGTKTGYNYDIVLGVFILIWANDTFAYLIGKSFGKHKLMERISPKKTIEGFIGGAFFTLLLAFFISKYSLHSLPLTRWIVIATIISIFGVLGDLIESMFKRNANKKDSSNLIPGHGGFLDRLDSLIFVTPFIFAFLYLIKHMHRFFIYPL